MKASEFERKEIHPPAYSNSVGLSENSALSWEEFRRENANRSGYSNRNSLNLELGTRNPIKTYSNRNFAQIDSNSTTHISHIENATNLDANWSSSRFGQGDLGQFSPTFDRLSPRSKRLFQDKELRKLNLMTNRDVTELRREDLKKNRSTTDLSSPTWMLDSCISPNNSNFQKNFAILFANNGDEIKPKAKVRTSNQAKNNSSAHVINESAKLISEPSYNGVHYCSSSIVVGEDDWSSEDETTESHQLPLSKKLNINSNTNNISSVIPKESESSESVEEQSLKAFGMQKQTTNMMGNLTQQYFQDIESTDELESQKSEVSKENTDELSTTSEHFVRPPIINSNSNYSDRNILKKPQNLLTNNSEFEDQFLNAKAKELEAVKKKSNVSSMCKNFENIFGRKSNDSIPGNGLSSLKHRKSSSTVSTAKSEKSYVECSPTSIISDLAENGKNSGYDLEQAKLIPSETKLRPSNSAQQKLNVNSSKSSTASETDYLHQTVVDNIIAASLTPFQTSRDSKSTATTSNTVKRNNKEEDFNPDLSYLRAVPDPDDRVQTIYKVLHRLPELDEIFILNEVFGQNRRSTKSDDRNNDQTSKLRSSAPTETKSDEMNSDASKKPFQVLKRTLRLFRSHSTADAPASSHVNKNRYAAPPNPPPPVPNHHATHLSQNHRNAPYSKNYQPPTISAPLIMDTVSEQKMIKVFASMENNAGENNVKASHEPLKNIGNHQNSGGGAHLQRSLTSSSTSSTIRPEDSISMKATKFNVESTNGCATPATKAVVPPTKPPLNMNNMTIGNDAKSIIKSASSDNSTKAKDDLPELKLNGFVGFDSLPYQLVRKCHANGFQFNLMCVGETGMGKTTLIESLFNMKMDFEPCNSELKTVELRTKTCEVCESGVRVKLRVVETAGFGDQLDKDKSAQVIVDYINDQFESYLKEELKIRRCLAYYDDTRIHACLYFISPTGHGLKALDVVTMRELSKRVNVIPVIAKADTACKDELIRFKQKIMNELQANKIEIYQFPTDDEAVRNENAALNALLPFAVVGSCDFVTKEDGRLVRARNYVWGRVEVENEEHCDFVKLREALLRINEDSLREKTHAILYENYRRQRLQEMKMGDGDAGPRMMEATLSRKKEFEAEIRRRDEQFNKEFTLRVQRKEADLKHREDGLNVREAEIRERFKHEMALLDMEKMRLDDDKQRILNNSGNGKKQRK